MDHKTKTKIESLTWDLVIGTGRAQEMLEGIESQTPSRLDYDALQQTLMRIPDEEEKDYFDNEFRKRVTEAAFP